MKSLLTLFIVSFIAIGCASRSQEMHEKIRFETKNGKIPDAIKIVKSSEFYPDKNSALLKLMEEALLHHLNGHYYQSLIQFDKARELSDELYTVSISKKMMSTLGNKNLDNYYGDTYERSMIRFYQALNHYHLYQIGEYESHQAEQRDDNNKIISTKEISAKKLSPKEKQFHLTACRSTLLEWNSLLENYKSTTSGKPVYKDDLLAKIFGGHIHEQMGSTSDNNIALGLYKEAKMVLFKHYSVLGTYNHKSDQFVKNFDKFSEMDEADVLKNFVEKTEHYKRVEDFLDAQIARLSGSKGPSSVYILLENGFISPKRAKKFNFPIPASSIPAGIPGGDFISFAGSVLNTAADTTPSIYFEMPTIENLPIVSGQKVLVKDSTGKVIEEKDLITLNPLTDLAYFNLDQDAVSNYTQVGTRVALKHITALASAYVLYKNTVKTNETLALIYASAAYAASNKIIEMSEEADLRSWTSLPHMFSVAEFNLKPGKYTIEYHNKGVMKTLGEVSVVNQKTAFIKQRIFE